MIRTGVECPRKKGQSLACLGLLRIHWFYRFTLFRWLAPPPAGQPKIEVKVSSVDGADLKFGVEYIFHWIIHGSQAQIQILSSGHSIDLF